MVNYKSKWFIALIIIAVILVIIIATTSRVQITLGQIFLALVILGIGYFLAMLFLKRARTGREPMGEAEDFARKWWEERKRERLSNEGAIGKFKSYSKTEKDKHYGFIFFRESGSHSAGGGMNIVVKRVQYGFEVKYYSYWVSTQAVIEENPFLHFEGKFGGAPNEDADLERQHGVTSHVSSSRGGVNVMVGENKKMTEVEKELLKQEKK